MATTWFCLVAVMLAIYVLLDGCDFGAGAIQMLVARTPENVARRSPVLARCGTATKYGCSPPAARSISRFPHFTPAASAASICH